MNILIYTYIQFDIYVYMLYLYVIYIYIYIYIYMNFMFFVYCNIVTTYTYDGHTGFTFQWSFPAGFTRRYGLHNCEDDPSYLERNQSDCVEGFFVLHGEVLKKHLPKVFNISYFKLIHPCSWIHVILVSHDLPVQTLNSGKKIEKKLLRSIVLLT